MAEFATLARARLRMTGHAAGEFVRGSRLRMAVVIGLVGFFWLLMFSMFLDAFRFLATFRAISDIVLDYLFAFFFLSLLLMMTISNAIISYSSLYRSEETEFLFALPVHVENTFAYRSSDCMVFSVWGMATLVVPMILAYGLTFPVPGDFYVFALVLSALFIILAAQIGAFFALIVALLVPRRKRTALAVLGAACAAGGVAWFLPLWLHQPSNIFSEAGIKSVIDRIAFCQHWALPSHWVSHGMLSAGRHDSGTALLLTLMLLSNVLFVGLLTYRLGHRAYLYSWTVVQGMSVRRRYRPRSLLGPISGRLLAPLPLRLRLLVAKDLKTFMRDPAQWSQFLLFFGLLALYIVNLPHFGVEELEPYWRSLMASLNLSATCLTLATLTSRFVFPQLSLEGRRIWVTGLLPMRRRVIIWGKFWFATGGTFLISAALIALSDLIIGLPAWTLALHLVVVACICCGLNGLAVGLGALYPRLGTDSPSKIVSSFGGTLNLICSICLLALGLVPVVSVLHLHMMGALVGPRFALWLAAGLAATVGLSALACVLPMAAGARAFERMEF